MLNNETIKKIENFVYEKPRSIQEIAQYLKKNWRTADRYLKYIEENFGTISTRTFREGTRGALKVVFWASIENRSSNIFQEYLEKQILTARRKEEFSAFDLFQHVADKNKTARMEEQSIEEITNLEDLVNILRQTKKELISFSGNLSYLNLKKGKINIFNEIEELIKKGVRMKVLCCVDIVGQDNIKKLLSLNHKLGKNAIEIRHHEHPLRAFVIDKKIIRIKEIKEPTGRIKELDKKLFIFYTMKDKNWAEWLCNIFNKIFNNSIGAEKRLEEINKIFK
ncbi:MAG: hypothetical protein KKB31_02280 [Nanoarchaeota archaeon]|nr:hypothetical protein [Nanoarchaeota archaeon]